MMNKIISTVAVSTFAVILTGCGINSHNTMNTAKNINEVAPYPEAKLGDSRSIIYLPKLKNEQNVKVELVIGKEMLVDCNIHQLSGSIKQQELKGWGYQYYIVENSLNSGLSTLMACPEGENTMKFIHIESDRNLIDYNSRLPIVVYAPKGLQVKYRLWTTDDDNKLATIE